jgi:hypothetical protein
MLAIPRFHSTVMLYIAGPSGYALPPPTASPGETVGTPISVTRSLRTQFRYAYNSSALDSAARSEYSVLIN